MIVCLLLHNFCSAVRGKSYANSNDRHVFPFLPISRIRDSLSRLSKLSIQQIESIFLSHVVPESATDSDDYAAIAREVGGAENVAKLIASLKQLIRDVSFFTSDHQVKQLLTSEVDGLSMHIVDLLCKLCLDHISEWRKNQLNCSAELLQDVDWNLKMISCTSDSLVGEPRVQLQFKTGEASISMDADQQGMRCLYNKLEEIQHKLDQMAKSSVEKK